MVASPRLPLASTLAAVYLVLVVVTIPALVVLTVVSPRLAPVEAWIHAVIVLLLGVLLPLRLRRAATGSRSALRAAGIIAAVLLLANVVEALIPGLFPVWMRTEMIVIAVLMAGVVTGVTLEAVRTSPGGRSA
ncbi:hypothetical protein [Brachybacterium sp. ACRRE]|uniref:hypothetical protein n=1 Tax=Brachybacterium sp. ACRRE TaxID=2918184 RepID=UPI001EF306F2|nr:hypothetical protein [Brachybacterium sp. ACRRE]MCG7310545.1 hypothetical protein [Brachybacterium sp. ACRRE]